ncbi:MAG: hypothetical protein MI785_14370 [Kiloniellales bacterium]|nr:hypothetical protein [Kiloniellales bacterium]
MKKTLLLVCLLPSSAFAEPEDQPVKPEDRLTTEQVDALREQLAVCNSDPQPMYGICSKVHEQLKQHYGGYENYRAVMSDKED